MHPALQRPRRFSFVSVARQRFLYQVSLGVDVPFYGFDRVYLVIQDSIGFLHFYCISLG